MKRGFTLIELMVVVAVIGILAAIAMPSFHQYIVRSKSVEAITIAQELKAPIVEYYRVNNRWPADNAAAGLPAPDKLLGNYVGGVTVADGAIHVKFRPDTFPGASAPVLTIRPQTVIDSPSSPVTWICGRTPAAEGLKAIGEDRTTVDGQFLPATCR